LNEKEIKIGFNNIIEIEYYRYNSCIYD